MNTSDEEAPPNMVSAWLEKYSNSWLVHYMFCSYRSGRSMIALRRSAFHYVIAWLRHYLQGSAISQLDADSFV